MRIEVLWQQPSCPLQVELGAGPVTEHEPGQSRDLPSLAPIRALVQIVSSPAQGFAVAPC